MSRTQPGRAKQSEADFLAAYDQAAARYEKPAPGWSKEMDERVRAQREAERNVRQGRR